MPPNTLEERSAVIKACYDKIPDKFFKGKDKDLDYFLSAEFSNVSSLIKQAFSATQAIGFVHDAKTVKLKQDLQPYIDHIKKIKTQLQTFERTMSTKLLLTRTYVPEQYAGIGSFVESQTQYLIATHGIGTCVGVACYCEAIRQGMITHLDSDHNNVEHLKNYFSKLFDLVSSNDNKVTVVLSSTNHAELDNNVIDALKQVVTDHNTIKEINIPEGVTCLILNLKDGTVYTEYQEEAFTGNTLGEALNAAANFNLYHLRNGEIYQQSLDRAYVPVTKEDKVKYAGQIQVPPEGGVLPTDDMFVKNTQLSTMQSLGGAFVEILAKSPRAHRSIHSQSPTDPIGSGSIPNPRFTETSSSLVDIEITARELDLDYSASASITHGPRKKP